MRRLAHLVGLLVALPAALAAKPDAKAIHQSAIVVDTHADTPQRFLDEGFDFASDAPLSEGQLDLGKARAGNLGAEFFSIWIEPVFHPGRHALDALLLVDSVHLQIEKHPDQMVLALTADDVVKARTGKTKRFAALMGIEGGHVIENDLRLLRNFYRLGVRYMTLTWANSNDWAGSCCYYSNKPPSSGLTDFGRDVVREMNRLGMMVDISHGGDALVTDALATSKAPIIASHSGARALTHSKRNLPDELLKAIAEKKGVVMVNFFSGFVDETFRQGYSAQTSKRGEKIDPLEREWRKGDPKLAAQKYRAAVAEWMTELPRPPLKALIDHIDYIAKLVGVDHVGLGSDFDGAPSLPVGMDSAADLPKITEALVERGYNKEQIHKILGGNILRVMRDVERVAKEQQRAGTEPPAPTPPRPPEPAPTTAAAPAQAPVQPKPPVAAQPAKP